MCNRNHIPTIFQSVKMCSFCFAFVARQGQQLYKEAATQGVKSDILIYIKIYVYIQIYIYRYIHMQVCRINRSKYA